MNVLLSNDDGIQAIGLRALYKELIANGHDVFVVAPMHQQSGVSHGITVFEPLRSEQFSEDDFCGIGIYGTPADCVKLGLAELAPWKPDIVISGINLGRNVGPDVFYSGTIGAASEGAYAGLPSIAVSLANWNPARGDLEAAARETVRLAEKLDWESFGKDKIININFPAKEPGSWQGIRVCPQSPSVWINGYGKREDPRGRPYWWMEGELDRSKIPPGSDIDLLERGYITITPLKFDHTDHEALQKLEKQVN